MSDDEERDWKAEIEEESEALVVKAFIIRASDEEKQCDGCYVNLPKMKRVAIKIGFSYQEICNECADALKESLNRVRA